MYKLFLTTLAKAIIIVLGIITLATAIHYYAYDYMVITYAAIGTIFLLWIVWTFLRDFLRR